MRIQLIRCTFSSFRQLKYMNECNSVDRSILQVQSHGFQLWFQTKPENGPMTISYTATVFQLISYRDNDDIATITNMMKCENTLHFRPSQLHRVSLFTLPAFRLINTQSHTELQSGTKAVASDEMTCHNRSSNRAWQKLFLNIMQCPSIEYYCKDSGLTYNVIKIACCGIEDS